MKKLLSWALCLLMLLSAFPMAIAAEDATTTEGILTNLGIPMRFYIANGSAHQYARNVWSIEVYDGRVYVGSGDFDQNSGSNLTGGSHVLAYNIETGKWAKEYTVEDEQISRFVKAWGNLYIPGQDPTTGGTSGHLYELKEGVWSTNSRIINGTHTFDVHFLNDGKTVFAGLGCDSGVAPTVSVSVDGGERFRSVFFRKDGVSLKGNNLDMGSSNRSGQFARVYNIFEYKGNVYATMRFNTSNIAAEDKPLYEAYNGLYKYNKEENIFDYVGTAPNVILLNSMAPSSDVVFKNRVVAAYGSMVASSKEDLTAWQNITGFKGSVTGMRVIGDSLYFMAYESKDGGGYTNRLYRTDDLKNFDVLYAFDNSCYIRSFCYYDGIFYLGTESTRNDVNATTGTVYSLKLTEENCTHANAHTELTIPTTVSQGEYSISCPDCGEIIAKYEHPFTDLKDTWYTEPVLEAYEMGMINGNSASTFGPDLNTTRAHLVTVLYNMEGKPDVSGVNTPLTDINGWYNDAIKWAYSAGVVNGKTATTFAPNENVTREQFAAILYRYAQYKKVATDGRADLSGYTDANKISSYAYDAMSWANARGYIGGVSATSISPKTGATRAQMATILVRYVEDNK